MLITSGSSFLSSISEYRKLAADKPFLQCDRQCNARTSSQRSKTIDVWALLLAGTLYSGHSCNGGVSVKARRLDMQADLSNPASPFLSE